MSDVKLRASTWNVIPIRWESHSQVKPVQSDDAHAQQEADWAEIQRWMSLADVALNRWSKPKPMRHEERDDAQQAA